jgi:signal transduction histidine kinase
VLRLHSDLRSTVDAEVRSGSSRLAIDYLQRGPSGFQSAAEDALPRGRAAAQVVDAKGRVVASYGTHVATRLMISRQLLRTTLLGHPVFTSIKLGRTGVAYDAQTTPLTQAGQRQALVVVRSVQGINSTVQQTIVLLLIAGPVALLTAALAGWWLVRAALSPVERMRRKAAGIGIDRLGERVVVPRARDELRQLGETLNAMLARLDAGVSARRRLVVDTSHGLRTPLAVMRAEIDVSLRRDQLDPEERALLESIRDEVDRMSRAVDNLLTVSEAEEEGVLRILRVDVDLGRVVAEAAGALAGLAAAREIRLEVAPASATVVGDPQRLRLAVSNLVENALKFTPVGGSVSVASWRRDQHAGVTVTDNGVGIAPEAQERLFERFYRVREDGPWGEGVPGSGLGLAICSEIAVAHGGEMSVRSAPGEGSVFTLALPVADRESVPAVGPRA